MHICSMLYKFSFLRNFSIIINIFTSTCIQIHCHCWVLVHLKNSRQLYNFHQSISIWVYRFARGICARSIMPQKKATNSHSSESIIIRETLLKELESFFSPGLFSLTFCNTFLFSFYFFCRSFLSFRYRFKRCFKIFFLFMKKTIHLGIVGKIQLGVTPYMRDQVVQTPT